MVFVCDYSWVERLEQIPVAFGHDLYSGLLDQDEIVEKYEYKYHIKEIRQRMSKNAPKAEVQPVKKVKDVK
jgi:hypothetical protein